MSIQTSTGVKIYISTQLPATFDLAGYGALTWTEIKEVTNIVPPSPSYQVVTHEPLKTGITQKNKGFVDYGDPTIDYALDTSDTGQQMLQSAASGATKNLEHSFKLTYPNGDIRYFSGRVFSSLEGGFSANSMVSGTSNVGVSRAIVKIPAISFAANYVTNTYSILGESKTFADAHTFTRSTTATFIGSNGLIQSAAIDAPRFTYDPVTLAPKGLLIESSRTNLLTYSEQFDNAAWAKVRAAVSLNATIAPDGTVTADRLSATDAGGSYMLQNETISGQFVMSVYLKADSLTKARFGTSGTSGILATIDLAAEEVTNVTSGATATLTPIANGWFLATISGLTDAIGAYIEVGDGSEISGGIYIWGAQLEAGSFASSYIPTTTAQVTRTADICTAKEFTSWYNQGEGSVFVDGEKTNQESSDIFSFGDLTNRIQLRLDSNLRFINTISSVTSDVVVTSFSGGNFKTSNSIKNDNTIAFNGNSYTGLSGSPSSGVNKLNIGANVNGTTRLNGTIAELNYYPTALSDEALQDLTR